MSNSQDLKEAMHDLCKDKSVKIAFDKMKDYALSFENMRDIIGKYITHKDHNALRKAQWSHENVYIKSSVAPNHATKRIWSVGELYKYFHTGDKALIFAYKASDFLAKLDKYTPIAKSLLVVFDSFDKQSVATGNFTKQDAESSKSNAKIMRDKFRDAYGKMGVAVKIAKELSSFAPPGVDDYIGFICEAYEKMGVAVQLVDKHCEKIEKAADEALDAWNETHSQKSTTATSGRRYLKVFEGQPGRAGDLPRGKF